MRIVTSAPVATAGNFIELQLEGKTISDATGALVTIRMPESQVMKYVASGGSYLSSHDRRVHAGVGTAATVQVEIRWPDWTVQDLGTLRTNRRYKVVQGGPAIELP